MSIGFNTFYIFSDNFSYNAVFNQTEKQDEWDWTVLLMLSFNHNTIKSSYSLIPENYTFIPEEHKGYKGGRYINAGLAPGLGIILPFFNFYASLSMLIGVGYMNKVDDFEQYTKKNHDIYTNLNVRGSFGYNGDIIFFGFNFVIDMNLDTSVESSGVYSRVFTGVINFFIGARI